MYSTKLYINRSKKFKGMSLNKILNDDGSVLFGNIKSKVNYSNDHYQCFLCENIPNIQCGHIVSFSTPVIKPQFLCFDCLRKQLLLQTKF